MWSLRFVKEVCVLLLVRLLPTVPSIFVIRSDMKCALLLCVLFLTGCSGSYIGMRGSLVPTLEGGRETGQVERSSNGLGVNYGVTASLAVSQKLGLQVDPSFRIAALTQTVSYPLEYGGTMYMINAEAATRARLFECPLLVTTRRVINDRFRTMFGVGPHFVFRTSTSGEITGRATGVDGPQVGSSYPINPVSVSAGSDDSILFGFSLMTALDFTISSALKLRGDLRFQYDLSNDRMSAYQFGTYNGYKYITAEYPSTRIGIGISLLFGSEETR